MCDWVQFPAIPYMKTEDLHPDDYKYIVEDGDPGFNPSRNRFIVDQVLRETRDLAIKKANAWRDPFRERAEAFAAYLKSPRGAESGNSHERYFGSKIMAELVGEGIKNTLKANLSADVWQKAQRRNHIMAKVKKA